MNATTDKETYFAEFRARREAAAIARRAIPALSAEEVAARDEAARAAADAEFARQWPRQWAARQQEKALYTAVSAPVAAPAPETMVSRLERIVAGMGK